jgi:mRNA-degrading endonuclease RelE of RelBE toxin-antitoxin system
MTYEIVFAPHAVQDYKQLSARDRSMVHDALERHLRHAPERTSRSSIKRLRGLSQPQYRLRVGDIRIFYDVVGRSVQILAIIAKPDARAWLEEAGKVK